MLPDAPFCEDSDFCGHLGSPGKLVWFITAEKVPGRDPVYITELDGPEQEHSPEAEVLMLGVEGADVRKVCAAKEKSQIESGWLAPKSQNEDAQHAGISHTPADIAKEHRRAIRGDGTGFAARLPPGSVKLNERFQYIGIGVLNYFKLNRSGFVRTRSVTFYISAQILAASAPKLLERAGEANGTTGCVFARLNM